MNAYQLTPVDTLFFRDAPPMQAGAGSGGHGARWPLPTMLHEALRARLLRESGASLEDAKRITHSKSGRDGERRVREVVSDKFRSLRTLGPFPCRAGEIYLPMPHDLVPGPKKMLHYLRPSASAAGKSNWPMSGLRPLLSPCAPSKEKLPEWVPLSWYRRYLSGENPLPLPKKVEWMHTESRIGIALNDETGTAEESKLYASEHLRLDDDVTLWFQASLSERDADNTPFGLDPCLDEVMTLGGEGRMARLGESGIAGLNLPPPSGAGRQVKWTLLTHAVFLHGWRPDWIGENGRVLLPKGPAGRKPGEPRKDWRMRVRDLPSIGASLVAAAVSKPVCFSGWDQSGFKDEAGNLKPGPKPTMLAVPAGSAYYFDADSEADAAALVEALHLRTRSDCFGEKGMGLGACGRWTSADVADSTAA